MKTHRPITRRTVLRGLGACIPLPFLEIMATAAPAVEQRPVRLLWLYTQSGAWMDEFTPTATGADWQLSKTLEPLAEFRSEVNVLSGLRHANAFKPNPVVNRHGQDQVCHLTGADLGRVPGISAKNSVSIDQIAGYQLGEQTRIPTLNVSVTSGSISFNANGDRVPSEHRPELIFDRLFGDRSSQSADQMERRFRRRTSILDSVGEQTARLTGRLGQADRDKLDSYMTSLREVERRIEVERRWAGKEPIPVPEGIQRPAGVPESRSRHIRLLCDLVTLALATDQTRIVTFKLGDMGCQYPEIGCPDGYHGYTHGAHGNEDQRRRMCTVDRARVEHLAYLLKQLRGTPDGEQDLLHNSFVHYASGMGSTHGEGERDGDIIPNLTAGRAGGRIRTGLHLDFGRRELGHLYVSMLRTAGAQIDRFVEAEGPLREIEV